MVMFTTEFYQTNTATELFMAIEKPEMVDFRGGNAISGLDDMYEDLLRQVPSTCETIERAQSTTFWRSSSEIFFPKIPHFT